jgi:hypothetical protein
MYKSFLIIYTIIVFVLSACSPDENNVPDLIYKARLWRISHLTTVKDSTPFCFDYYSYDSKNRIVKEWNCLKVIADTNTKFAYTKFMYNNSDQKKAMIRYYHCCNDNEWTINDSTSFEYDDGLLAKEEIFIPSSGAHKIFTYHYENNLLVRKFYTDGYYMHWVLFEYKDSLCVKEMQCSDSVGTKIQFYTIHSYYNNIKVRSELYAGDINTLGQIINYTYNDNQQLILEEAIGNPDWSGPLSHIYRYDYERIP